MRRIIMKEARPGMLLERAIAHPNAGQPPVVASGVVLTVDHLARLHELGTYDAWIAEPDLSFFDALELGNPTVPQQRLRDALRVSFQKMIALGANGPDLQRPLIKRHRIILEELVVALIRSAPQVPCFTALATQHEELLQHSADVCVVATLLGLQLENYLIEQRRRLSCRQAKDVLNLAMGCLFHDVGEMFMPAQQRESSMELAFDAHAGDEWKQHTSQGYGAVRTHMDPSAAAIVLHHHQHFDGTGFAVSDGRELAQRGGSIHVFSRIAALADTFAHALNGPGGVPQPAVKALARIGRDPVRQWFDPVILSALQALIPPFVPGMVVTLSNRRQVLVRQSHEDKPCQPEVQVLRELDPQGIAAAAVEVIDLAESRTGIHITEVEGNQVEGDLFVCGAGGRRWRRKGVDSRLLPTACKWSATEPSQRR